MRTFKMSAEIPLTLIITDYAMWNSIADGLNTLNSRGQLCQR